LNELNSGDDSENDSDLEKDSRVISELEISLF